MIGASASSNAGNSRGETLLCALERLGFLREERGGRESLTIHLVGADELECPVLDGEMLSQLYGSVIERLSAAGYKSLSIAFVGPNLSHDLHNQKFAFQAAGELVIHAETDARLYHDFCSEQSHNNHSPPDVVVLFNAGIWGYVDWLPTLHLFFFGSLSSHRVALVVTSYTMAESEDDYDTMDAYYKKVLAEGGVVVAAEEIGGDAVVCDSSPAVPQQLHWLWDCEPNPHASQLELARKTCVPGEKYFDNFAWQCVRMSV